MNQRVQNDIDRFHLVQDVLMRLPQLGNRGDAPLEGDGEAPDRAQANITQYGVDMPKVRGWVWSGTEK